MNTRIAHISRRAVSILTVAIVTLLAGVAAPAGATTTTYSIDRSVSVAPSTFAGATSGGDGYDVGFYQDHIFNVFHHGTSLQVMCVNRDSGAPCVTSGGVGVSRTISATIPVGFAGSLQLTDVIVNGDGTLTIELHGPSTDYNMVNQYGNPLLGAGTPITLSGVDPDIDGTYHVAYTSDSIHNRLQITTSDGPSSWGSSYYCGPYLAMGIEYDSVTSTPFTDMADGSACEVEWSGLQYLRYQNLSPQSQSMSFQTSAKPTVYVDQANGYLYVPAALNLTNLLASGPNDAADSWAQPGVVCIDLNAYVSSTNPGCSTTGGPSTWTPLGNLNDVSSFATSYFGTPTYGLDNMVVSNGRLWIFNPVSHAGQPDGTSVNQILCFDPQTASACPVAKPEFGLAAHNVSYYSSYGANELALSHDEYGTPFFTPEPATDMVTTDNRLYVTMDAIWTSPFGTAFRYTAIACVDVSDASNPVNCSGYWPVKISGQSEYHASIPPIPYLSSTGTVEGICFDRTGTGWECFHSDGTAVEGFEFDASLLNTPLAQPNADGKGSGYSPAPLVIGSKVFVSQLQGGSQVACFDFATQASCALGASGSYPKVFADITAPYGINEDPQIPGCIWLNSDGGSTRATIPTVINFDSRTGGSCTYEGSLATVDFITTRSGCEATSVSAFTITSNATNHLRTASVSVSDSNGTSLGSTSFKVGGSTDLTSGSAAPSADFTDLNPSIQGTSNLSFHVHLATTTSSNLSTVTVHLEWTAARAGCDQALPNPPRNLGATPSSGSALVSWQPPAAGPTPTKYTVTIPGKGSCVVNLATNPSAPLSCSISGLTNGTTYTAQVVSETIAGTSLAATVTVTPRAPSVVTTPFTAYVHGWTYSGATLTAEMRASVRDIAVRIMSQHCSRVTLTGYANFTALPSLSRNRAQNVATILRTELNKRGGSSVTLTVVVGGSTDKFVKTVLNRAVVVRAS